MAETLLNDHVEGYEVSTIRTDAGGAKPSYGLGGFFSSLDHESLTTWPFETMVFKVGSRKGLYHEAYANEEAANDGHVRILNAVKDGSLEFGKGVEGSQGVPTLTPEQWAEQSRAA
jgi:hypothetical protein